MDYFRYLLVNNRLIRDQLFPFSYVFFFLHFGTPFTTSKCLYLSKMCDLNVEILEEMCSTLDIYYSRLIIIVIIIKKKAVQGVFVSSLLCIPLSCK